MDHDFLGERQGAFLPKIIFESYRSETDYTRPKDGAIIFPVRRSYDSKVYVTNALLIYWLAWPKLA